jgi:hypothetical protein
MLSMYPPPPPINFRMSESVFMKVGMYITAPELTSTAYFPFHRSVRVSHLLLGNRSIKLLPLQRIHTNSTRRFLCGPYRIRGK